MDFVIGLFSILAIAILLMAFKRRLALPVRFISFDEIYEVQQAAFLGQKRTREDNPKRRVLVRVGIYLAGSDSWASFPSIPAITRLSKGELEALAPFIDDIIAGNGDPWPLPAEYDCRAAVLGAFKERMVALQLWPLDNQIS
jgi:hypothetical protein